MQRRSWGGTIGLCWSGSKGRAMCALLELCARVHHAWMLAALLVDAVKVLEPRVMMPNIAMHPMNEHFGTKTCQKRQSHASSN